MRIILLLFFAVPCWAQSFSTKEISKWKEQADKITIIRDNWGVPHIYGKTDADAVFGMIYAQCEDDFARVERNYLTATARMAEAAGERFVYQDLRQRLYLDTLQAISIFNESPGWLKKLCYAFADGANYYLYTHPQTKPVLLRRFEPWMPLLFSEGSIGGDIERVSLNELKKFYGEVAATLPEKKSGDGDDEPRGSNGIAIAPSITTSGNALLLINPHTSFYFRTETHMVSEEGLNAYGAATWGQFFIYQGFNEHCGWMHTSSQADVIDEYAESIVKKEGTYFYKYGEEWKQVQTKKISIAYKNGNTISRKEFTAYATHHGPVVAQRGEKWIVTKMMNEPLKALTQSYSRTKSKSFEDFKKSMELRTNSSNNTVYADAQGNIAYWHGNFMPRRDTKFNWSEPVDGSNPATEWKVLHPTDEMLHLFNPKNGWIQNCNSTPFTVSGEDSPKPENFPSYMAPDAENWRGVHAVRLLKNQKDFDADKLIRVSRDPYLPPFENLVPAFVKDFNQHSSDTLKTKLTEPVQLLRTWDLKWSTTSVATTLAIFWTQKLRQKTASRFPPKLNQLSMINFLTNETTTLEKMNALYETITDLEREFGSWKISWGEVNRYQRLDGKIEASFDDTKPSIAVPFTSSLWGSLASFGARKYNNTKKMYGTVGNSFIAVVEFGKKVKARSITTGGSSSNPSSIHFTDQAQMYVDGKFKDVLFYKEDVLKHVEQSYTPGK
ncbi:MAG: acylase [Bacteroidetes bacterium]|nr:acylase [Bacteroidota bacterium]